MFILTTNCQVLFVNFSLKERTIQKQETLTNLSEKANGIQRPSANFWQDIHPMLGH
jgi:outer membrane lipoprotein-sorting protein